MGLPQAVSALADRLGAAEGRKQSMVVLSQQGHFRGTHRVGEVRYTATQRIDLSEVGFLWRARLGSFKLLRAADQLKGSVAQRSLTGLGILPLDIQNGGAQLLCAERTRYLSELVWAPDAIVQNRHLWWSALDEHTLLVSTGRGPGSASVRAYLDTWGRIQRVEAESDCANAGGHRVQSLARVSFCDYEKIGGRWVPRNARSSCYVGGQSIAQWECKITDWRCV